MNYESGFIVVIILIYILLLKLTQTKDKINPHKIKKPVLVKCIGGARNISIRELISILKQFNKNIENSAHAIDGLNYLRFNILINKSMVSLHKWIIKQDNKLFLGTFLKAQEIKSERDLLKRYISTQSELVSESKSDEDDRDITVLETKKKLLQLAHDLQILADTLASIGRCSNDVLDITAMELLMNALEEAIKETDKKITYRKQRTFNGSFMQICHKGECGLKDDESKAAYILTKKNMTKPSALSNNKDRRKII